MSSYNNRFDAITNYIEQERNKEDKRLKECEEEYFQIKDKVKEMISLMEVCIQDNTLRESLEHDLFPNKERKFGIIISEDGKTCHFGHNNTKKAYTDIFIINKDGIIIWGANNRVKKSFWFRRFLNNFPEIEKRFYKWFDERVMNGYE